MKNNRRIFAFQNKLYYSLNRYLNSEQENAETAREIAEGYKKLWPFFKDIPTAPQTIGAPFLRLADYQHTPYRQTLTKLADFARTKLAPYLRTFFIHGSLATMDFVPGFSDLDTLLVLKQEICINSQRLENLRQKIQAAKKMLRVVDPLEHHGFIFSNEQNLNYYPQHYLPITVLRYAKVLGGTRSLTFNLRDSSEEAKENFYHYYNIFKEIAKTGVIKNKPGGPEYQLKWFVSMLLLMPSLYLQAKGIYLYKKYSFDLVRHPFLDKLQNARKNFKNAEKILGRNYFKQALDMLQEWRRDLLAYEKKRKFINNPKKLPLVIYQKARRELIGHFRKNSDVLALYEYGSVSAPGISDLDLILVTREKLKNKFIYPAGPNIDRVAKGTLMVMPKNLFADIKIFDAVRLKKVFGERIKIKELTKVALKLRLVASVIDWLPERLIRVTSMLHRNPLDIQYALRYLRSFAYSVENARKLINFHGYPEFMSNLREMRKNWQPQRKKELLALIKRAVYLGYEALSAFTEKYAKAWPGAAGELTLFSGQKIIFTNQREKIDPDWAMAQSTPALTKVFVSAKLLPHFLLYSRQSGTLAAEMKNKLAARGRGIIKNAAYELFLKKKFGLATKCAEFLRQNGFKSGLYRFGFYFKPK